VKGKIVEFLVLKNNFWGACKQIIWAELGDKTFLIAIIITISSCQCLRSKGNDLMQDIIKNTVTELDSYIQRKQMDKFDELQRDVGP
jgi:hypothetical protein